MAKDAFIVNARCTYCGRPAALSWDSDLVTCDHEICKALAYRERARRIGHHRQEQAAPARLREANRHGFMRARTTPVASKGHKRPSG